MSEKSLIHTVALEIYYAKQRAKEENPGREGPAKLTIQVSISTDLMLKNNPNSKKWFESAAGVETFKKHRYTVNPRQMEPVVVVVES